jgi:hypothetical protein
MRTSFYLKILAETLQEAEAQAISAIAGFLAVDVDTARDSVNMELKVSYPKAETVSGIEEAAAAQIFQVIAFANLKQGVNNPFWH